MPYKLMVAVLFSLALATAGVAGHWPVPPPADVDMTLLIRDITGIDVVVNAEIACFTPRGEVRGLVVIDDKLLPAGGSLKGDDASTVEIDGFESGDTITFLYWDPITGEESAVVIDSIGAGEVKFAGNGMLVIYLQVELGVNDPAGLSPSDFKLSEPFPNPFNAKARISFNLLAAGDVNAGLYNLTGSLIRTIAAGRFSVGTHNFEIDGSALPSGMYLVVLSSGSQRQVVRAVLMK